jgi:hypothetical protein
MNVVILLYENQMRWSQNGVELDKLRMQVYGAPSMHEPWHPPTHQKQDYMILVYIA